MTIAAPTVEAVALALRIDEPELAALQPQLTRNIEAATSLANRQAPDAPEAVGHEAIIRFVGWLYEGPQAPGEVSEAGAWRRSGAASLLAPWTQRRAGVIGDSEAAAVVDGESSMIGASPIARVALLAFANPGAVFADVAAMTAQELFDGAVEATGASEQTVSVIAPIVCHQRRVTLAPTGFQWLTVAVPDGTDAPSHFRLADNVPSDNWGTRWRRATGLAASRGTNYSVHWWPVVQTRWPAVVTLEWPQV